jgi:hypothetical protein
VSGWQKKNHSRLGKDRVHVLQYKDSIKKANKTRKRRKAITLPVGIGNLLEFFLEPWRMLTGGKSPYVGMYSRKFERRYAIDAFKSTSLRMPVDAGIAATKW